MGADYVTGIKNSSWVLLQIMKLFIFQKKHALKLQFCQIPPLLYFFFIQASYLVLKAINVWWPWSLFQIPFEWQVAPMPTALHNIVPPWVKWLGTRGLPLACMPVHLHFNSIEKFVPPKKFLLPILSSRRQKLNVWRARRLPLACMPAHLHLMVTMMMVTMMMVMIIVMWDRFRPPAFPPCDIFLFVSYNKKWQG